MATRLHRGANDDTEWQYDELEDFYALVVGMAVDLIEAGRMNEDRAEDRVALKMARKGVGSLTEEERDIMQERLNPLAALYWEKDRTPFEAEFVRRRAPGFYDRPADDSQGELF
jgi:hypothetical protein